MITRGREFSGVLPPEEMLLSVISEHDARRERYALLRDYYLGKNAVLSRRRAQGLPNNRIAHCFARYIVTVTSGYLTGNGITYRAGGEDREALDGILDLYRKSDISSVDGELARNAAIYGKGVELITVPEDGILPRAYALDPMSAFVVYDEDIRHEPLFGVYLTDKRDGTGSVTGRKALVFTDSAIAEYALDGKRCSFVRRDPHFFGRVPMVEYWNDESEKGDFEWVIPLIDAYDSLQSDRLNDKDQFADKLLVLTGCTLDTDEEGRPPWLQLRMDKALCLPDGDADARYLTGEMNESGNEILRSSLERDIHKLSLVPDLSDDHFSGNVSGVAMKYKLMGLEQLMAMKQKWFSEGLRERMRLMGNYMRLRGGKPLEVRNVVIGYTRPLPENLSETASVIKTAREAGAVSTRTMVEMLHGSDWDESMIEDETRQVKEEKHGR